MPELIDILTWIGVALSAAWAFYEFCHYRSERDKRTCRPIDIPEPKNPPDAP